MRKEKATKEHIKPVHLRRRRSQEKRPTTKTKPQRAAEFLEPEILGYYGPKRCPRTRNPRPRHQKDVREPGILNTGSRKMLVTANQEILVTAPKRCSILFVKVRIFEKIVFQHVKDSKKGRISPKPGQ